MLATAAPRIPTGSEWAFEIKWDGYRNLIFIGDRPDEDRPDDDRTNGSMVRPRDGGLSKRVRIQSRSGHDVTEQFGSALGSIADHLNAQSAILDGEVVALDETGRPDFGALQRRDRPIAFYAFDLLQLDGTDTVALPYVDRRRLLDQLLEPGPSHLVPSYRVGGGSELVAVTEQMGLEGVVAKRLDSRYAVGSRSKDWLKIKHRRQIEVTIGGYSSGSGARGTQFGALLVGLPSDGGGLRFAGGIGTGFDDRTLTELTAALTELTIDTCPFDPRPPTKVCRDARWVSPDLRAIVEFSDFSDDGLVRHGSFIRIVPPATPPSERVREQRP